MAQQDEGIMALMGAGAPPGMGGVGASPEDPQVDMYEFRKQAYPAAKDAVREVSPEAYGEMQAAMSSELAAMGDLDPEEIETMLEVVDYINENPEEYPEVRAALISAGSIDPEDFPEQMDVEYFAAMEVMLQEALMQQQGEMAQVAQGPVEMMPPQGFAKGGIAEAAQLVASRGRYGDTMLAHITPAEARMLKARGGSGTINPETGLPEYFKKLVKAVTKPFKSAAKAVGKAVKSVLKSPIGRIVATVGLTMIGVPPWLASGLVTKAGGGSWKDAFKSAAVSFLSAPGSPLGQAIGRFAPGLDPSIRAGLTATGASLLTGSNLKDAVTSGITAGLVDRMQARQDPTGVPDIDRSVAADTGGAPIGTVADSGAFIAPVAPQADIAAMPLSPAAVQQGAQAPLPFDTAASGASFDAAMSRLPAAGSPTAPAPAGASPSMFQQAKDFFMPGKPTPEAINARAGEIVQASGNTVPMATAIDQATKEMTPGMLRQYGPAIGLGIAGLGMAGGFEQKPLPESEFAGQMRQPIDVPEGLRTPMQNLPGVRYDAQGNIVGSQAWSPYSSSGPTEVATPGIMSMYSPPPMYTPPPAAPGFGGPVSQPYNTASMYSPFLQPRRFNTGGVASLAQGGYPRRIGKIEGPGTETSDDIPAMLSDGEFVMTARAVRGAGNGSRREGAKKMYAMMHQLEQNAARG
jgi:hypothetical protein